MEKEITERIDNNIGGVGNAGGVDNIGGIENTESLKIGQIDYAILKCISYGIKKISDMKDILQIRNIIIEKHVYNLSKEMFIRFQKNYIVFTDKGMGAMDLFEKDQPFDIWGKIDEFLIYSLKKKKEEKIRLFKMIDMVLVVVVILSIIFILYNFSSLL